MVDATATTQLLARASRGDGSASEQLFPLVYDELRGLAGHYMARQDAAHTLQATALVHEAWVKLIDVEATQIADRAHFFRLAASAMRSILVDHARGKGRRKRGGDRQRVELDGVGDALAHAGGQIGGAAQHELVDLDESLKRLEAVDEQLAHIVELRFFAGLTAAEAGEVLGVSSRTVERGWRTARAWLGSDLGADPDGDTPGGGGRPG